MSLKVGDKFKFEGERMRYTVRAVSDRWLILTKPFNARKTYMYTIVDKVKGVRGRCNLIFNIPHDVTTPEGAAECLRLLENNEMAVSGRRFMRLSPHELWQLSEPEK